MNIEIRKVITTDIDSLKTVLDSSNLFPSELLDDMILNYLSDPKSQEIWFTCTQDEKPISLGYCAPEKLTDGTYNLLAIAVNSDMQGKGIGSKMMEYIEKILLEEKARILIVDTSSDDSFTLTRKFYEKIGYTKEATIRDFWREGEDKVTFYKKLN